MDHERSKGLPRFNGNPNIKIVFYLRLKFVEYMSLKVIEYHKEISTLFAHFSVIALFVGSAMLFVDFILNVL